MSFNNIINFHAHIYPENIAERATQSVSDGYGIKMDYNGTLEQLIEDGKKLAVDESCLPFKIYLGHVKYLENKCDYILVPRICNYGKKKRVCMRFNGIYDVVHNLFPTIKIINYNIDYLKQP